MPIAVAGANALGAVAAGSMAVAGPVGLAAAGAVVGVAATAGLARRITRNRPKPPGKGKTPPRPTSKTGTKPAPAKPKSAPTGGLRAAGTGARAPRPSASGLRSAARTDRTPVSPPPPRTSPTRAPQTSASGPGPRTTTPGRGVTTSAPSAGPAGRSGAAGVRSVSPSAGLSAPAKPKAGAGAGRVQSAGRAAAGAAGRAGSRLAAGAAARAEKTAARSLRRETKGVAKARRQSGLDPTGTRAKPLTSQGSAAQKRALRRSAVRHAARMTGSAAVAAGAGLLYGLWNIKRPGKAFGHMRAVWHRLASRARRVRAARDAATLGTTPKGRTRVPDSTVNNPRRTTPRPKVPVLRGRVGALISLGRTDHSGGTVSDATAPGFTRLSEAAEVMLQAASTFDPEHMTEFQTLVDDLPDAMGTVQETLRVLAELSDEKLPVDSRVVEEIGEGYRAMSKVIDALEDVGTVYRRVHAEDIERNENPRNGLDGERRWNVG
ncbi:hypothetical protein OG711_25335 [Streptomyces uncialis]|uniref:hypothetical protein n=1 Tax=Streptomyces uncialis TaxID=1048205 RepID=UPI002E2FE50D|nr:hypothetical protein [Streptomyces uncialis]